MNTVLDVRWAICNGKMIPLHHQYYLLGAVSRICPVVHEHQSIGIHPIRGFYSRKSYLELTSESHVVVRTSLEHVPELLPLSGKKLTIAECSIRLGVPQIYGLIPAEQLSSSLVTIKGYETSDGYEAAVQRQLDNLKVSASTSVEIGSRKILQVKNKKIVGFQVNLGQLSPNDSLVIQQHGLGGRRHMGCGIFNPIRKEVV